MARANFLIQAVTARSHASELRNLLSRPRLQRIAASVAYVRKGGVDAVANKLKRVAKISKFFVGIRNDITSIQAVESLLRLGVKVLAVDTATRSIIFHPKIFVAKGETSAWAIVGSANMTFGGLHNNIEAGAILELDLADTDDKAFVESSLRVLDGLPAKYPSNVFQIRNLAAAKKLFHEGRLVDEDIVTAKRAISSLRKGHRDKLPAMKLVYHAPPRHKHRVIKARAALAALVAARSTRARKGGPVVCVPDFIQIWDSRGLKERALCIPSGRGTHATGSMLWNKGAVEGIDQRHFFRNEAFAGLNWQSDSARRHIERAEANFQIIIKGLNYGVFRLKLSHNTSTTSRTYRERNSMTQIHWGPAMDIIRRRDLLGRIMMLYRREGMPPDFMIEID